MNRCERQLLDLKIKTKRSWVQIHAAALLHQGRVCPPFSTANVARAAQSFVRRAIRETGMSARQIELFANSRMDNARP